MTATRKDFLRWLFIPTGLLETCTHLLSILQISTANTWRGREIRVSIRMISIAVSRILCKSGWDYRSLSYCITNISRVVVSRFFLIQWHTSITPMFLSFPSIMPSALAVIVQLVSSRSQYSCSSSRHHKLNHLYPKARQGMFLLIYVFLPKNKTFPQILSPVFSLDPTGTQWILVWETLGSAYLTWLGCIDGSRSCG